jgi:MoxR-like ATPase
MEKVTIEDVDLYLSEPDDVAMSWVGQSELVTQVLASWLVIGDDDLPLSPRLLGKPGVGKTTLAYHAGRSLGRPVYLFQATMDTRPEDLIVTPVISEGGKIRYMASSVVSAMIKGGVAIIDEGNRMSEKEYIHSRLQPRIFIDFPERDEELLILQSNLPFADDEILEYVVEFLQAAHEADERYSVRDGINIARYALKRLVQSAERLTITDRKRRTVHYLKEGASMILDPTAAEYFRELMDDVDEE